MWLLWRMYRILITVRDCAGNTNLPTYSADEWEKLNCSGLYPSGSTLVRTWSACFSIAFPQLGSIMTEVESIWSENTPSSGSERKRHPPYCWYFQDTSNVWKCQWRRLVTINYCYSWMIVNSYFVSTPLLYLLVHYEEWAHHSSTCKEFPTCLTCSIINLSFLKFLRGL